MINKDITEDLDRNIHEEYRLGIMCILAVNDYVYLSQLNSLLRTTKGNLMVRLRKLEEIGYIVCEKSFVDRVPRSSYKITIKGRIAFNKYLDHMEILIDILKNGGNLGYKIDKFSK